jgi:hypothetical protein
MKKLLLLLTCFPFCFAHAQDEDDDSVQTSVEHSINKFTKYHFSDIFNPKDYMNTSDMGDNFQRLYIHFAQVTKKAGSPALYEVKGMWRQ